jgi:hypothetical protein
MTKLTLQDLKSLTQKAPVEVEIKKEGLFTTFKKKQEAEVVQQSKKEAPKKVKKEPLTPEQIQAEKKKQESLKLYVEKRKAALTYLCETYPLCFDLNSPKPLQKEVGKEVLLNFPDDLSFTKTILRKALGYYTNRKDYLESLLSSSHRVNLIGEACELITEEDKEFTKEKLDKTIQLIEQKKKEKAIHKEKFQKWKAHQKKSAEPKKEG